MNPTWSKKIFKEDFQEKKLNSIKKEIDDEPNVKILRF